MVSQHRYPATPQIQIHDRAAHIWNLSSTHTHKDLQRLLNYSLSFNVTPYLRFLTAGLLAKLLMTFAVPITHKLHICTPSLGKHCSTPAPYQKKKNSQLAKIKPKKHMHKIKSNTNLAFK